MASVLVPPDVDVVVEIDRVELPVPVTEVGAKPAVAPVGSPATLKATFPVKPLCGVTLTEYVVLLPGDMVCDAGAADNVKSGVATGFTFRVTFAECDKSPLVPVTASV